MKKLLLSTFCAFLTLGLIAQCTPDFNFGEDQFISPDPEQGETFEDGEVGQPYTDIIYLEIPSNAGEIDPQFTGGTVDSLVLVSVTMNDGSGYEPMENYGLEMECNNGGWTADPCTFVADAQGCVTISGIPTEAGVFPIKVNFTIHGVFFGQPISSPYEYEGYTLTIDQTDAISDVQMTSMEVSQNYPNPFTDKSEISVNLPKAGEVTLHVKNLIGENVLTQQLEGTFGKNDFEIMASDLRPGIYIYTVEFEGQSMTRRMVVGK